MQYEALYPQLLVTLMDKLYRFKAHFDDEKQGTLENGLSVYNQLDPASEEKMFSKFEQIFQVCYPVDWYETSFVFNIAIKEIYDSRQRLNCPN